MSSAHGWADDEARPMPYAAAASNYGARPISSGSPFTFTPEPPGAWSAVGFRIDTGGIPVTVTIAWTWTNAAVPASNTAFSHPGDGSLILVPTRGHKISVVTVSSTATVTADIAMVPSNQPVVERSRLLRVADPAAGASEVIVYSVPEGAQALLGGLTWELVVGAQNVQFPESSTVAPTFTGLDIVLAESSAPGARRWLRQTLWSDRVPYTFAPPHTSDPDQHYFFSALSGTGQSASFIFVGSGMEGIDAAGDLGTAGQYILTVTLPTQIPDLLPAGTAVILNNWWAQVGGLFQNPNLISSDPRLNSARVAPPGTNQISNINALVIER